MSAPAEIKSANWSQGMINTVVGADGGGGVSLISLTTTLVLQNTRKHIE